MGINAFFERLFAGRWIAGYYPEDALQKTEYLNSKCILTLINYLGEELSDAELINETVKTYLEVIKEIKLRRLAASISLKPTELGLYRNYRQFHSNYLKIVKYAKINGVFVWLDAESPDRIDDTIKAYKTAVKYGNAGICIQAYLKRSVLDVEKLLKINAKIRLVKGAYLVKEEIVFRSKNEINHNFVQIMATLFQKGDNFMIATHDHRMIQEGIKLNKKYKKNVTYAMLNGIRNKYAKYLADHGHKVAIYVPFGKDWIGFAYRRLVEQRHATLILRSLLETQRI